MKKVTVVLVGAGESGANRSFIMRNMTLEDTYPSIFTKAKATANDSLAGRVVSKAIAIGSNQNDFLMGTSDTMEDVEEALECDVKKINFELEAIGQPPSLPLPQRTVQPSVPAVTLNDSSTKVR
jgi:hypothetical protein